MADHTLSALTALATVLAALAAAAAVWVSWRGIAKQNAQAKASREDFKLSFAADLSMKLDDRFNTEDFRQARSHAAQSLLSSQSWSMRRTYSISSRPWGCWSGRGLSRRI